MNIRTLSALVALAGFGLSFNAHAATYRCDVGGSVYLTDKPCALPPAGPATQAAAMQPRAADTAPSAITPRPPSQRSEDAASVRRTSGDARSKERERQPALRADAESTADTELLSQRCGSLREALRSLQATNDAERTAKRVAEEAYNAYCLSK